MDFTIPTDGKVKVKESEKTEQYLNLSIVMKKLWNMKVTVVRIIVGALETVFKNLKKRPNE